MSSKPEFIIFDIDGTLSDASHRHQLAQAKDWEQFHSLAVDDPVIIAVADLMLELSGKNDIILLTGRPDKYRSITEKWLKDAGLGGIHSALLMRGDDDFRPDIEMKILALEEFFGGKENVIKKVWFVVDDRDKVVEGLRNYGLTVLQPAPSSY